MPEASLDSIVVGEVLEQENPYSNVEERGRVRSGSAFFYDWAFPFLLVDIPSHSVKIPSEIRSPIPLPGRKVIVRRF
jgi:hypothetical protein